MTPSSGIFITRPNHFLRCNIMFSFEVLEFEIEGNIVGLKIEKDGQIFERRVLLLSVDTREKLAAWVLAQRLPQVTSDPSLIGVFDVVTRRESQKDMEGNDRSVDIVSTVTKR